MIPSRLIRRSKRVQLRLSLRDPLSDEISVSLRAGALGFKILPRPRILLRTTLIIGARSLRLFQIISCVKEVRKTSLESRVANPIKDGDRIPVQGLDPHTLSWLWPLMRRRWASPTREHISARLIAGRSCHFFSETASPLIIFGDSPTPLRD